jgi:type I restriction enzyme M protein
VYGAILGDIIGSQFEHKRIKSKEFKLISSLKCHITDDSILTIAVAKSILESKSDFDLLATKAKENIYNLGNMFPSDYGTLFKFWLNSDKPEPYNSYGNGAAMRVSPCGIAYENLDDVKKCSYAVSKCTHNHPEGLKSAELIAALTYMARNGFDKESIYNTFRDYYNFDLSVDQIRSNYSFSDLAKDTIPHAVVCFLESNDYIDAIRNAVSLGGDSDTLAAITGSIAAEYYGIPKKLITVIDAFIYDDYLLKVVNKFNKAYYPKII